MALHNCDEVAVAGFGYDMSSPNAPLHYYENIKMSAIKEVGCSLQAHLPSKPTTTPTPEPNWDGDVDLQLSSAGQKTAPARHLAIKF